MSKEKVNVKIYLRRNKYVVRFKSSHLKGEIVCRNIVELDDVLNKITYVFPDMTFHVRVSQGALGKYSRELDSPLLLYTQGYKFLGYIRGSDIRIFYNHELSELVVIDEEGWLKRYNLN